jgi:glycosyltransferase involved in cell wall biosynthesis
MSAAADAFAPRPKGRMPISLVIPAYDEEVGIDAVLEEARRALAGLGVEYEIIVVDDASRDRTADIAVAAGVTVVRNVKNGGYGYALMRGITQARFPTIAIVDADGSYPLEALPTLFERHAQGFAMVVGERHGPHYTWSARIRFLRWLFRSLAEFIVGQPVPDVNSGMRIFDRAAVLPLIPHLSYGFSFTTSITLLFMLRAFPVSYVPVEYRKRRGESKVRYGRDALRALQIIASVALRLNPIKVFLLAGVLNLSLLAPIGLLAWFVPRLALPAAIVLEGTVLLLALGLMVEGLIDKQQFLSRPGVVPSASETESARAPASPAE